MYTLQNIFWKIANQVGIETSCFKHTVPSDLIQDIEEFFNSVKHLSVEESFSEKNKNLILYNFETFLLKQKLYNTLHSLEILKEEKGENDPYRANGKTPNIYHEIRNCFHALGMIKNGFINMDSYEKHGGLDTDLSGRLLHDSIEDKGKTKIQIYASIEGMLHRKFTSGKIDEKTEFIHRNKVSLAVDNIDRMTRKDSVIDSETGRLTYENGKPIKQERFNGNKFIYFYRLLETPLAILGKYADRTDNNGTRFGIEKFTLQSNINYAEETRGIYGRFDFDERAIKTFPFFKKAIKAADAMLGLHQMILEGVNDHKKNKALNPETGLPFRLNRYLENALPAFDGIPNCFHPIAVTIHSLSEENDARIQKVKDRLILPHIQTAIMNMELKAIEGVPHQYPPQETRIHISQTNIASFPP